MSKENKIKKILFSLTLGTMIALSGNYVKSHADTTSTFKSYTPVAYDISEYQGKLTDQQVINLKNEIHFVILRIQDGQYHDKQVNNNIRLMEKYNLPYGVYSFSRYNNPLQAQQESQRLFSLAPRAKFYVNDFETKYTTSSNQSAVSWAAQMKKLTKRPVILYGSQSMLDRLNANTLKAYSAVWLANYNKYMPNPSYNYDLWQFTDRYLSNALGKKLDADTIPVGAKQITFWTGSNTSAGRKAKKAVKHTAIVHSIHKQKSTAKTKKTSYRVKGSPRKLSKFKYTNLSYKHNQGIIKRSKVTATTNIKKAVVTKHRFKRNYHVLKQVKVSKYPKVSTKAKTKRMLTKKVVKDKFMGTKKGKNNHK